jgi:membrane associated rhomboid family serine protease
MRTDFFRECFIRSRTILFIILANVVVFLMWQFAGSSIDPQFMMDHFLVSWSGLLDGRVWILITSVFSHSMFWHLLINMIVLYSFGPVMVQILGPRRFLIFYFLAGLISSLSHAMVSNFILHQPDLPALGASGAISAVILLFALIFPKQKILLFGIIPIPALIGALLFIGLDVWGLSAQAQGGGLPIGHGAHLGGALTGIIYYFFFFRRRFRRRMPS